ncbi:MAG: LysR family transcriptional regulator [Neisseriaceae bacterium]|nr:LysR family transcriptional regulator [Neisseriaceae bacterium]
MNSSPLELRHLRSFLGLRGCGGGSAAAKRLFLTQSALSHQIKLLEDFYNAPLFERKSSPLRFTTVGERLLRLAEEILPAVTTFGRDIVQLIEGAAGELRIAVECHTCFDWLIPAMDDFRTAWPAIELDIVSGFQADPVSLLLTKRADLAIVSHAEEATNIEFLPLFSYEMVGIAAKTHPLAAKNIWQAKDFADETLITYPVPDDMLDLMRKVLIPKGISPKRRTTELTIAMVQLVASKRGIAALPYWAVFPYLQKGYISAHRIEKGLRSDLYAAIRADDKDTSYLSQFCHIIRNRSFAELPGLSLIE